MPPHTFLGPTNGDNEVWNLAKDPEHYDAIVTMMKLRERLRGYVEAINNVSVHTGMPMMRPVETQSSRSYRESGREH